MKPIHLYIHVLIIFTDLCKSAGMPHWLRVRRADSTYTTSICENSQAILRCPSPGDTMHIVSANYGRTDDRTCVRGQPDSETSCISDTSFHIIYDRCEGRTTCVIPANNGVFGDPCPGVRKYLEVKYSCGAPQDQTTAAPTVAVQTTTELEKPATTRTTISTMGSGTEESVVTVEMGTESPVKLTTEQQVATIATTSDELPATEEQQSSSSKPATRDYITMEMPVTRENVPESPTQPITEEQGVTMATTESHLPLTLQMTTESQGAGQTTESTVTGQGTAETPAHGFTTRRDHISLLSTSNGLPYPSWGTSPDVVTQRDTTTPQPTIDTNSPVNLTPSKPYRQTTQLYVSIRHQSSETPQLPVETPETPFDNYPTVPSDAPKTPAETTRTPARTLQPPNGTVELPTETPAPTAETPVSSVKTPAETPATSARTPTSKSPTGAQTLAPTVITLVQPVKTPGTPTAETQTTAAETLAPTTRTPVRPIETSATPAMTPAPTAEKPSTPHGIPVSSAQTSAERRTTTENSPSPSGETQTPGATSTGEPDEDPGQQSSSSDLTSLATAAMVTKDYGETSTPENGSTKPYPRVTTKKLPPPITDPVMGTTKSEHLSTRETKQPIMTSIIEPRTKQTKEPIITPVSSGTPIKSTEQPKPTTATGSQSSATNSEEPIRSSVSEPSPSHTEHPTTKINATTGRRQTSTATTQRRTAKPTPPSPVMVCDSTVARDLTWPATQTGNLVIQQCPEGTTGQAIWYCDGTPAKWSPSSGPDLSDCKSQAVEQISEMISNISSPSDVQMVTELLVKSTSGNQTLYGGDIVGSIDNMNELLLNMDPFLQDMTPEESYQFADGVVEANLNTGSNLLEHSSAWVDLPTDKQSEEATKLLKCMEQSGFMLVNQLQVGSAVLTVTNKILMELSAQNTSDENLTDAEFPGKDMEDDATQWKYVTDSIKLTNETLKQKSVNDTTRLVFFLYDEISGFLSVGGKGNTAEESNNTTESIVNSKIISASINQMSTPSNLAEPAIIVLEHTETENVTAARCSFWNFTRSGDGEWSDYGCETVESNETHTVCACSHLTNFAIIMDIRGLRIPLVHHFALSVITYAGFIISICCMVLCLVTFCACRNLQNDRNTIHKNLCLCLLIAEVIFMAGIDRTENETTCAVIAGLLHYFFLAAFAWMSLEGIQIYVMLIEVFEAKKSRKKYYYPYGYVVPAIVVGVSAGIYPQGYGTSQYCWITIERGLIWAFVGPVCAVILVNIIFLLVAGVIMYRHSGHAPSIQQNKDASQLSSQQPCPSMRRRSSSKLILGKTKCQETQAWLKGACVLLCLLGITWVFGLLYINSETLFMAYIFTVLNAFQGLFIFVFHCLMNDKVKKEYKRHIRHSRCCPSCIRDRISSSAYSNQGQGSSGASSKKAARASMGNHSSDKRHSASSISQNMVGTAGATTRAVAVIQPMLHNGSVYEYNPETREKGIQADISPGITRQDSREEMLREAVDVKFNLQPLDLKRTSSDPCLLTPLNQNGYATFMFDQLSRDGTSDTFDSVEDSAAHHSMPNLLLTSPQILQKQQQLELVDRKILQNGKPPQLENLGEQDVSLVQYRRIGSDWNVRNGGTISRARTNSGSSNLPVHIRHTKILDSDGRPWSRISISPILVRKQLLSLSGQDADNPNARGLFSLEDRAKSGSEGSIVLKKWRTTDDIVTSSSISDEETTNQPTEISDSNGDVPSVRTKPDGTGSHGSYQGGTPRKSRYTYFETYL